MAVSCTYCGSSWDIQRDHVIPKSYLRWGYKRYEGDWLVPACKECNGTLGDQLLFNIPARAKYLLDKYKIKYKKVLNFPKWDSYELGEMGDRLKESIMNSLECQVEIKARLENLKLVSELPEEWLAPSSNDSPQS